MGYKGKTQQRCASSTVTHWLAPWTSFINSLCLKFLLYKSSMIRPRSQGWSWESGRELGLYPAHRRCSVSISSLLLVSQLGKASWTSQDLELFPVMREDRTLASAHSPDFQRPCLLPSTRERIKKHLSHLPTVFLRHSLIPPYPPPASPHFSPLKVLKENHSICRYVC